MESTDGENYKESDFAVNDYLVETESADGDSIESQSSDEKIGANLIPQHADILEITISVT
ncbi:hypothetical protein CEXT_428021, partial [Caerostris extrusa]